MATKSLVVELDARTKKLDKALNETNKRLDKLDGQTKKNDKSFGKLTKTAEAVGSALAKTATAGLALATALTAVVLKSAEGQRELGILARQAKLSTEEFNALTFATKQYGFNAKDISDLSKDLADKIGEFGKVGTGAFQDFADVVGLTREEARAAAVEFENMSSDQILGAMVSQLEAAGASANEMTFVLESMGSEASRLIPLFANNSKELNDLTKTYNSATSQLALTANEIEGLQGTATSFDLLTDSLAKGGTLISAQIAPLLSEFFGGVISIVPQATQTILDFINAFKAPEDVTNIVSVQNLLIDGEKELTQLIARKSALTKEFNSLDLTNKQTSAYEQGAINQLTDEYNAKLKSINGDISEQTKLVSDLKDQEKALLDQRQVDTETPEITATQRDVTTGTGAPRGTGDEIAAIADRFKTEQQLLKEKLDNELILIGDNDLLKLQLRQEYNDNIAALDDAAFENQKNGYIQMQEIFGAQMKKEIAQKKESVDQKLSAASYYTSAASALNSALFEDNKAISAGVIVADTAVAIGKANALGYPLAIPAIAAATATGIAQLANLNSATKGGGNIGGGSAAQPAAEVATTTVESSGQVVTDEGSGQLRLKVSSDDGDEVGVALAKWLNSAQLDGRTQ